MYKYLIIALLAASMTACSTTYQYLINTNFQVCLAKGMTKEQFRASWEQPTMKVLKGNLQVSARQFTLGGDQWDIFIYNVYEFGSLKAGNPTIDHKEYAAFRNGRLEEWGVGTLPVALQGKPDIIHIESGR